MVSKGNCLVDTKVRGVDSHSTHLDHPSSAWSGGPLWPGRLELRGTTRQSILLSVNISIKYLRQVLRVLERIHKCGQEPFFATNENTQMQKVRCFGYIDDTRDLLLA